MRVLSTRTHAMIGLATGVALLVAPNLFGFSDVGGAAVTVPRLVGLLIIGSELLANNGLSPLRVIPMKAHLLMDQVTGLFLAASPWLFGFADEEANAWVPHVLVGLFVFGYTFFTRTDPDNQNA